MRKDVGGVNQLCPTQCKQTADQETVIATAQN